MRRMTLVLLISLQLAMAGCGGVLLRADFKGASNGPLSTGSTGTHQEASSPNGDEVYGSNLQEDTVRFVNSVYPDDALALMLAPNPVTAPANPVLEFRPVSASSNHDRRTFFWLGRKNGNLGMDCLIRNWTGSTTYEDMFTLRFASGEVFILLPNSVTLDMGSLGNGVAHNVWVSLDDHPIGARVEVSPHGGPLPLVRSGVYFSNGSFSPDDVRVSCSYNGSGNVAADNYLFDKMIFRSK